MTDKISKSQRSSLMSKVRSKNTQPERLVRSLLFKKGFRFRIHVKSFLGCPDIVLKKYKAVIFVNGCFWHGHICKAGNLPKSNFIFWNDKIKANKDRDILNKNKLMQLGWKILTVWECNLKGSKQKNINDLMNKIASWLQYNDTNLEI